MIVDHFNGACGESNLWPHLCFWVDVHAVGYVDIAGPSSAQKVSARYGRSEYWNMSPAQQAGLKLGDNDLERQWSPHPALVAAAGFDYHVPPAIDLDLSVERKHQDRKITIDITPEETAPAGYFWPSSSNTAYQVWGQWRHQ